MGVRRKVNLLVGEGYPFDEVMNWPLARVNDEAELTARRVNQKLATEATLLQAAVGSILSEEAGKIFRETVEKLNGE